MSSSLAPDRVSDTGGIGVWVVNIYICICGRFQVRINTKLAFSVRIRTFMIDAAIKWKLAGRASTLPSQWFSSRTIPAEQQNSRRFPARLGDLQRPK
jgi:hypothetical protein